jgi:hypothetical protein
MRTLLSSLCAICLVLAQSLAPPPAGAQEHQTRPAFFLAFNGCPKPDAETMKLKAKRLPGKPLLDIATTVKRPLTGSDALLALLLAVSNLTN